MATLVEHGHDISGPTAARPTNVEPGQRFFDTTTGESLVWNGTAWQAVQKASAVTVGGTAIGNANALGYGFNRVTGANNSAAVRLPAAIAGSVVTVKSLTSGSTLQIFPAVGDKINGAAANAVYNMANLSLRTFHCYDDTDWYTDPETPT